MRALWLRDRRPALRRDLPPPQPLPGEALVRVLRAGVCGTDLALCRGYYPYDGVLGHEFVGRVEQGPPELIGERVVGEVSAACGACAPCRAGHRSHCARRTVLGIAGRHGAFADFLTLPVQNLHRVPEAVSDDEAVFTEPLAAAVQVLEQVPIPAMARVLVAGDGKLGQLVGQVLALGQCELHVCGRHPDKLALLAARGARVHAGPLPEELIGAFDVAVECTGNPEGFALARRALRPRGTLVLKSTYAGTLPLNASSLVVDEITVVGSRCGPFAAALRLLSERRVTVAPLVHARFPLEEAEAALERAAAPGVLKVLIDVSDAGPR